ncbi:hypothetical protein ACFMPD_02495 [Sedimentitalea sp. HM32M-2]|uniref:hypothetical protein n=1 Tax=Sedimentitalea sp. HM32M-2 TaxID=3351566 RepID=UPI00363193A6
MTIRNGMIVARAALLAAVSVGLCAGQGRAQVVDPMAIQRCVWSCLASSPGNQSWQYHQCVAQRCQPMQAAPVAPTPALGPPWTSGVAADGVTRYAGIHAGQPGGPGLYYMCDRQGQSYLMLYRHAGPPGMMRFFIGSQQFSLPFDRQRGELTVNLVPGGRFLNALAYGQAVQIVDARGAQVMSLGLNGAAAVLQSTIAACRN